MNGAEFATRVLRSKTLVQGQFICPCANESKGLPSRGLTGRFGADMAVSSVNDGPVTILFDTEQ